MSFTQVSFISRSVAFLYIDIEKGFVYHSIIDLNFRFEFCNFRCRCNISTDPDSLGEVGSSVREIDSDGLRRMLDLFPVYDLLQEGQVPVHEDIVRPQQVAHHVNHWQLQYKEDTLHSVTWASICISGFFFRGSEPMFQETEGARKLELN